MLFTNEPTRFFFNEFGHLQCACIYRKLFKQHWVWEKLWFFVWLKEYNIGERELTKYAVGLWVSISLTIVNTQQVKKVRYWFVGVSQVETERETTWTCYLFNRNSFLFLFFVLSLPKYTIYHLFFCRLNRGKKNSIVIITSVKKSSFSSAQAYFTKELIDMSYLIVLPT